MVQPRVGERFDRYLIEERIGAGGMGEVFRAQDTKLRRSIALKIVLAEAAPGSQPSDGAARLLREARAAAALDHPNAVSIFDVGELDGCAYIAMELVDGRNLRAYIGDESVDIADRVRWLIDVARALGAAHKRGLVHRDVKPENVMVRNDGTVKVLDFGIARKVTSAVGASVATVDDTITREGVVVGTPTYMAPEQLRGESLDGRADQFSWGVLAYELLTGALPWPTKAGAVHVVAAILSQPAESLVKVMPEISAEVSDAVARALAKSRDARFAEMDDVVRALGGHIVSLTPGAPRARVSTPPGKTPDALAATRPSGEPSAPVVAEAPPRRILPIAMIGVATVAAIAFVVQRQATRSNASSPSATSPVASALPTSAPLASGDWGERRLTAFSAENRVRALAVSADGSTIAYADEEGVWVAPTSGGGRRAVAMPKEVGDERPDQMDFFPDGKRLLVGGWKKEDDPTWIIATDGSPPVRARSARQFALSPDGARVAFTRDTAIVVGALEGGATTRVASMGREEQPLFAWSPSGDALALIRAEALGASTSLEIAASDGTSTKTVVSGAQLVHTGAMRPTWTAPDRIAYAESLNDDETAITEQQLDAARAPVGAPRRVWKGALTTIADLTFRAGRFFYLRYDSQRDVYIGRLSADATRLETPLTRFTTSEANDSLAGWMPDGRILFTSLRDGKARIYAQAIGARAPDAIVGDAEMAAIVALPSGDVVAVRHNGDTSAVVVSRPGGATRELFSLGGVKFQFGRAEVCARCAPTTPTKCVIGAPSGDDSVFSMFEPTTGTKAPPFHRRPGSAALLYCSLSADAKTLYLPQKDSVHVVTVATGVDRTLAVPPSSFVQYIAPLDARRYLFSGMSLFGKQYGLGRLDRDGHADALWTSDTLWIWSPMIAPNGRDLATIVRLFDSDVFMLAPLSAP